MQYALKSFLERLGLSGNEMKIYAAALEHGESTPTELASRARVHRVAAYPIIESLVSKGLLTQTDAKHRKRVSPTHPKQLHALLKDRKRTLRKLELAYEDILPDLEALYRQSPARPRVQFYQGVKGLEQVNADIIETLRQLPEEERETLSYSNPNVVDERFDDYILGENGYVDLRKRYKIRNKAIGLDGPVTQDIVTRDKEELRE
ncbi:MAG: hypothetical protein KC653_02950, partial [Candidatus Andersenbacteria bacterium]|nr:hypothetical protein [Candidatus Andersenbacteria bacterium]